MGYDWDFRFLFPYVGAFLRGTVVTLEISLVSFIVGTILGVILGVLLHKVLFRSVFLVLNDAIRAVPPLVLIFAVYYFPTEGLLGLKPPSPLWSAILAMAIAQAAYTADLVRAAIDGVSPRLLQAGRALGMTESAIRYYFVLPDIARQILPAEMAFLIGIVRLSSLASVIGAEEVVFVARVATAQNFRSIEAWIAVALIYVALVVPLTIMSRKIETSKWLKRRY